MVEIRPAREEDHPAIVKLWHRGWHDAHAHLVPQDVLAFRTPEHFLLWLEQCADMFHVATNRTDLYGFVSVKGAEVVKLYVETESRGTGIASALLSHAEFLLARQGVIEGELYCTAGNVRAQNFYTRLGWDLYQTFQDALWMPEGVPDSHLIETHRYRKNLGKPA
jgi:GNAT superfamily N-acetyltransferase